MKILHITPTYYPATYWGGPIFTVYYLNNALARISGVELKVLTTDAAGPKVSDRLSEDEKRTSFPYEVNFTRRVAGACVSTGLLRQLPKCLHWADVVHLTATYSFPTIPVLILCWMYRKPVVWSLRGALLDDQNRYQYDPQSALTRSVKAAWNRVCRWFISLGRVALHVTTEQERKASAKVYPDARFTVIPNGVEVPEFLPARDARLPDGKLRLMYIGRLAPKKGIENLLRGVTKVDTPVSLDMYGTGTGGQGGKDYRERLVALAKELGLLDKKVRFCGHVDGEAKARAFLEADVCVVPSYSENFCIVVAEALAMGLPVIVSSRLPQWKDVVQRNCGLWVDNNPEALAQAIRRIRDMDLSAMGKNGWEWMKDAFGWEVIAKKMYEVYLKMSHGKAHAC